MSIQRTLSFFDSRASSHLSYFPDCKVDCRDKSGCTQNWRCERWIAYNPSRSHKVGGIPNVMEAIKRRLTTGEPYTPEVAAYVLSQYPKKEPLNGGVSDE